MKCFSFLLYFSWAVGRAGMVSKILGNLCTKSREVTQTAKKSAMGSERSTEATWFGCGKREETLSFKKKPVIPSGKMTGSK